MGETDKVMQALRDGGHRPVLDVDAITTGPSVPGWRLVIGAQGPSAAGRRAIMEWFRPRTEPLPRSRIRRTEFEEWADG